MDNIISVKKIQKSHINDVVDVHCSSFRNFFLTELGTDFLYLYYSSYLKCNSAILFGCFENEKLIGFCAAAEKSLGFNKELVKVNLFKFIKQGIKLLITNPKYLKRLYYNSNKISNSIKDEVNYSELFSIAVLPFKQNYGAGKILIKELENELKLRNCIKLTLTTDTEGNENVLNFYKKMGFSLLYNFSAYPDRTMSRLIKNI